MMTADLRSDPPDPESSAAPALADAQGQPRYRRVADTLRDSIESGRFGDNDALPSERELAEQFQVSRDTVRKAVRFLEERAIIYSDRSRGTFVAPSLVRKMSRQLDGFSINASARGAVPGQTVLAVESTTASLAIAGLLSVDPGHPMIRIKRVRLINGLPVGLHDAYLLASPGLSINRAALEKAGSLYALLGESGIIPAEAIENLSAASADADDAALLNVPRGSPLLVCERVTLSERREPLEYCLMKYVPSYRYTARISKHSGAFD